MLVTGDFNYIASWLVSIQSVSIIAFSLSLGQREGLAPYTGNGAINKISERDNTV